MIAVRLKPIKPFRQRNETGPVVLHRDCTVSGRFGETQFLSSRASPLVTLLVLSPDLVSVPEPNDTAKSTFSVLRRGEAGLNVGEEFLRVADGAEVQIIDM